MLSLCSYLRCSEDLALYIDCLKLMMPILSLRMKFFCCAHSKLSSRAIFTDNSGRKKKTIQPITFPKATERHTEVKVT